MTITTGTPSIKIETSGIPDPLVNNIPKHNKKRKSHNRKKEVSSDQVSTCLNSNIPSPKEMETANEIFKEKKISIEVEEAPKLTTVVEKTLHINKHTNSKSSEEAPKIITRGEEALNISRDTENVERREEQSSKTIFLDDLSINFKSLNNDIAYIKKRFNQILDGSYEQSNSQEENSDLEKLLKKFNKHTEKYQALESQYKEKESLVKGEINRLNEEIKEEQLRGELDPTSVSKIAHSLDPIINQKTFNDTLDSSKKKQNKRISSRSELTATWNDITETKHLSEENLKWIYHASSVICDLKSAISQTKEMIKNINMNLEQLKTNPEETVVNCEETITNHEKNTNLEEITLNLEEIIVNPEETILKAEAAHKKIITELNRLEKLIFDETQGLQIRMLGIEKHLSKEIKNPSEINASGFFAYTERLDRSIQKTLSEINQDTYKAKIQLREDLVINWNNLCILIGQAKSYMEFINLMKEISPKVFKLKREITAANDTQTLARKGEPSRFKAMEIFNQVVASFTNITTFLDGVKPGEQVKAVEGFKSIYEKAIVKLKEEVNIKPLTDLAKYRCITYEENSPISPVNIAKDQILKFQERLNIEKRAFIASMERLWEGAIRPHLNELAIGLCRMDKAFEATEKNQDVDMTTQYPYETLTSLKGYFVKNKFTSPL